MFSAVNIWEIAIKKSLGKPGFGFSPDDPAPLTADKIGARYNAPIDLMEPL